MKSPNNLTIFILLILFFIISGSLTLFADNPPVRFFVHFYFDEETGEWVYVDEIPLSAFRNYYNHWEVFYEGGKPRLVEYHSSQDTVSFFKLFYDDYGREVKAEFYMGDTLTSVFVKQYNAAGQLDTRSWYQDGELKRINYYNADQIRIQTEEYSSGHLLSRTIYNDQGILIRQETYYNNQPDGIWYYYNNNGKKTKVEWYDMGSLTRYNKYIYDYAGSCPGNIVRAEVYNGNGDCMRYDIFIYNENCELIRRDQYNCDGQLIQSHYQN